MYEYGLHDASSFYGQPEGVVSWPGTEPVQHTAPAQPPLGLSEVQSGWDPAEELAYLLQESRGARHAEPLEWIGFDETADTVSAADLAAGLPQGPHDGPRAEASHGHRRVPPKAPMLTLFRTGSLFSALLVAVIAAVVSIFSGLAISEALRQSAGPGTAHDVVSWWPLLLYGPWMVASLSILRAALHQRRAIHSWSIVLLFSTLATLLCVAQAPRTFAAQAAATLPPIAALACFQQLVRQITLTRPPRHPVPRHRNRTASPLRPPAAPSSPGTPVSEFPVVDHRPAGHSAPGYRFRYGS